MQAVAGPVVICHFSGVAVSRRRTPSGTDFVYPEEEDLTEVQLCF